MPSASAAARDPKAKEFNEHLQMFVSGTPNTKLPAL
jgi:hypothetical protein